MTCIVVNADKELTVDIYGSWMPLDTEAHWSWRNPLNIIPGLVALLLVIALVGLLV
jgi:hypothetical protein